MYNILIEFGSPMELVQLIKICLNEIIAEFGYTNICLKGYVLKMMCNKEMLYRHCFSTSL